MNKKISLPIFFFILILTIIWLYLPAKSNNHAVGKIISLNEIDEPALIIGAAAKVIEVELKILTGQYKNQILLTEHYILSQDATQNLILKENDKITVFIDYEDGELITGIEEYYKTNKLLFLCLLFVALIVLISGYNGLKSLISLFLTLILIFGLLPILLFKGYSPILLAVIFSIIMSVLTIFIVYGFNLKSYSALAGTIGGVIIAGVLAYFSVTSMRLSGWTGHETLYLQNIAENLNLQGLLVCGIIIGSLGAVMDVTISISSSICEIKKAEPSKNISYLFKSGLKIGKDIIGTMTNTLILAYAGSSFALILLFVSQKSEFPLFKIINMEFISSEVVRAISGSLGMVSAIPITALITAILLCKKDK